MIISRGLSFLLNLLFPLECIICEQVGPDICNKCLVSLQPPKGQTYDWITSFGNYHDENMKKLLWYIKRMPNGRACSLLARAFAAMVANRPEDPSSWYLVPIPITKRRFRERGYNQATLLAKCFGKSFNLPVIENSLIKIKNTQKQGTAKSKEERMQNIIGSFGIKNTHLIQGKNIIIIDDITTTGSTLVEARNLLLVNGAQKVLAWTVAN